MVSTVQKLGEAPCYARHLMERVFHPEVVGIPRTSIHKYALKEKIRLLLSAPVWV